MFLLSCLNGCNACDIWACAVIQRKMTYCNRRLLDFKNHSERGESMVMFYLEGTTFLNGLISKHKAFEHLLHGGFLTQSQNPSHIAL